MGGWLGGWHSRVPWVPVPATRRAAGIRPFTPPRAPAVILASAANACLVTR